MDLHTEQPIDSVLCQIDSVRFAYTDSLGQYEVCGRFGGCVPDCQDILVIYSKKGYKTLSLLNPEASVIRLEKE